MIFDEASRKAAEAETIDGLIADGDAAVADDDDAAAAAVDNETSTPAAANPAAADADDDGSKPAVASISSPEKKKKERMEKRDRERIAAADDDEDDDDDDLPHAEEATTTDDVAAADLSESTKTKTKSSKKRTDFNDEGNVNADQVLVEKNKEKTKRTTMATAEADEDEQLLAKEETLRAKMEEESTSKAEKSDDNNDEPAVEKETKKPKKKMQTSTMPASDEGEVASTSNPQLSPKVKASSRRSTPPPHSPGIAQTFLAAGGAETGDDAAAKQSSSKKGTNTTEHKSLRDGNYHDDSSSSGSSVAEEEVMFSVAKEQPDKGAEAASATQKKRSAGEVTGAGARTASTSVQDANMRSLLESIGRFQKTRTTNVVVDYNHRPPPPHRKRRRHQEDEDDFFTSLPPAPPTTTEAATKQRTHKKAKTSAITAASELVPAVSEMAPVSSATTTKKHDGTSIAHLGVSGSKAVSGATADTDAKDHIVTVGGSTATKKKATRGVKNIKTHPKSTMLNVHREKQDTAESTSHRPKTTAAVHIARHEMDQGYGTEDEAAALLSKRKQQEKSLKGLSTPEGSNESPGVEQQPPKRGRGRPRKVHPEDGDDRTNTTKSKKKRRKIDDTDTIQQHDTAADAGTTTTLLDASVIVDASLMAHLAAQSATTQRRPEHEPPPAAAGPSPHATRLQSPHQQGSEKEHLVVYSTDRVCRALMDGPWPGCLTTDFSVIVAALKQFANDIVLPAMFAEDPRPRVSDDVPVILGTMLMLREVLILNADSMFGLGSEDDDEETETQNEKGRSSRDSEKGSTSLLSTDRRAQQFTVSTLATAVVVSAIDSLEGYGAAGLPKKFLLMIEYYESGQGDVSSFLSEQIDGGSASRPTEVRWPNGDLMQDGDLDAWLTSRRYVRTQYRSTLLAVFFLLNVAFQPTGGTPSRILVSWHVDTDPVFEKLKQMPST